MAETIKFPCTGCSRYLHHGVELDSVSPAASSEADAGLSCPPGRVDGAVVTCTVAAPATWTVVKPTPVIPIGLQVLRWLRIKLITLLCSLLSYSLFMIITYILYTSFGTNLIHLSSSFGWNSHFLIEVNKQEHRGDPSRDKNICLY